MSLTAREIALVVAELRPLAGGFVQRLHLPEPRTLVLELRQPGASHLLLICAEPGRTRLHEATTRPSSPESPLAFQGLLRAELIGCALESIEAIPGERAVVLGFRGKERRARLVAELTGRHGNLFLVGKDGRIRGSAVPNLSEKRDNRPGQPYSPLIPRVSVPRDDQQSRFAGSAELSLSRAIELAYTDREQKEIAAERRRVLLQRHRARRSKLARTVEKVKADVARASAAEDHRRRGELLKANFRSLRRGLTQIRLVDYRETGPEGIEVELDPTLTPAENMEKEFRQYRRLLSGQARAAARLAQLEAELAQLDAEAARIESRSDEELAAMPGAPSPQPGMRRRNAGPSLPYREHLSGSGQRIRVGRGAKENDALTFRHSKGNDVWLHARGVAGAHVVVPLGRDEALKDETLRDAALLAAHASEAKARDAVDVAWTRVKYVHKVKGTPGAVTYSQDKTVLARPDPERLARLQQSPATED